MRLRSHILVTLFLTELRMLLRDRRVLLMSVVVPILIMPLMMLGSRTSVKQREQKLREMTCRYAVSGPEAAAVRQLMTETRTLTGNDFSTNASRKWKAEEVICQNPTNALELREIQVILNGYHRTNYPGATNSSNTRKSRKVATLDRATNAPLVVELVWRGDRDDSTACVQRVGDALRDLRRDQQSALLKSAGFDIAPSKVAAVAEINLASKGQVAGLALGKVATVLLLLFILSGGAVAAIDSLAGEKERGTLETLLTTAATRVEIIVAKHLTVLALALLITVIQSANLLVYVGFKLLPVPGNFAAAVTPVTAILLLFLYLPLAALAASILLLISGHAKTYKEAQLFFFPVFLIGLAPALAPFFPGLPLQSIVALVPIAGLAIAARDILVGSFNWPMIAVAWLSTAATAVWAASTGVRYLSAERLVTAADTDAADLAGGPALFGRHVLRWFAALWAALLVINNYISAADIRVQVLVNLVGIFFGGSLLMMLRYKLPVRPTLALRAPRPAVWPAVLIGVPGGALTAVGLFKLTNVFIPVPTRMLEGFSQSIAPEGVPFWQLLFFLTVMPGIFEEIAFRGVLLHGLKDRMHPVAVTLVVGLVFGIFHVALFRFVPTASLGIVLAAVTLLTGSIYPAMLWHTLSNGFAILMNHFDLPINELHPTAYFIGAAMLATAFWIIFRNRSPYPGLRPWRRSPHRR